MNYSARLLCLHQFHVSSYISNIYIQGLSLGTQCISISACASSCAHQGDRDFDEDHQVGLADKHTGHSDSNPKWEIGKPISRLMVDMIILPNAQIRIINGAERGSAGWGLACDPVLTPLLYSPSEAISQRFQILSASTIARMYHSTTNLLPDGRVLVGGSNTNTDYAFNGVLFLTELRLEAYSP
ncbi:hypothetical protein O6H91_11G044800 [Diphasiastrum complanatum]|uniref:Uncharacterized protein n=1 Tax=Diphasiastrum complanatum TaxID=34168 RepID=A0ACC2C910_DIPCM|nr:hypothetical protein O6H91_11G044800 [Diphasiastrum complanatum]